LHRTAISQILGPNSSLRIFSRSDDHGKTWTLLAVLPAVNGRDLRDPCFYVINGQLAIKALTRLPVSSTRDSDVHTVAVGTVSTDGGQNWSTLAPIGPETWSYWRIRDDANGVHYNAAYEDGDNSVSLFSSTDGVNWNKGAQIYGVAADTPLETELDVHAVGQAARAREDGRTADELLGNVGRLRTKVCWAAPPFATVGLLARARRGAARRAGRVLPWLAAVRGGAQALHRARGQKAHRAVRESPATSTAATSRSSNTASCRRRATRRTPAWPRSTTTGCW